MNHDQEAVLAMPTVEWLRIKAGQFPLVTTNTMTRLTTALDRKDAFPAVADICKMSEVDVRRLPNLGETCLRTLLMFLHFDGLTLDGSPPPRPVEGSREALAEENRALRDALSDALRERDEARSRIRSVYRALNGRGHPGFTPPSRISAETG